MTRFLEYIGEYIKALKCTIKSCTCTTLKHVDWTVSMVTITYILNVLTMSKTNLTCSHFFSEIALHLHFIKSSFDELKLTRMFEVSFNFFIADSVAFNVDFTYALFVFSGKIKRLCLKLSKAQPCFSFASWIVF